jgi:arylsulfatase A-like enzyme
MMLLSLLFRRVCRACVLALLAVLAQSGRAAEPPAKPNVLFIFADDQCFDTIRALGNDEIETPNLDRLAKQGTTFTQAYNMGGWHGAVCVASRTMLNTGRYLWHAKALEKNLKQERDAGRLWAGYMKLAGYRTYMTGKWHVSIDAASVFDVTRHVRGGMPNQTKAGYDRPREGEDDPWSPSDPKFGGFWQGGKHWSEVVADDALEFLATAKQDQQPFFMYIAFNAPHDPRQSPQAFVDKYPPEKIRVPESFQAEYPYAEAIGSGKGLRDEQLAPFPRTKHAVQVHRAEYYAIITHLDQQIGRILDQLQASGQADDTWIVFTADHGLAVGHHGLIGKQNMYDHSVRVPFIVKAPGVAAGAKIDTPIYLQDVMPTTLQLAGVEVSERVEFKSLLPLLRNETEEHYEAIYGAYIDRQRMITQDGHKLILYPKIGQARLYNLANDPQETRDLAAEPAAQPMMKKLFAKLLELQRETGDTLVLRESFPE